MSDREQYWQPGQQLPVFSPVESSTPRAIQPPRSDAAIIEMLQGFQKSVDTQFQQLSSHLGKIDDRMDEFELQQKSMQERLQNTAITSSFSTPSSSSSDTSCRKRGRVTPTALQVSILYIVYACNSMIILPLIE